MLYKPVTSDAFLERLSYASPPDKLYTPEALPIFTEKKKSASLFTCVSVKSKYQTIDSC